MPCTVLIAIVAFVLAPTGFRYAYLPAKSKAISTTRTVAPYYDLSGETLSVDDARRRGVSASNGGVLVDNRMLALGRREF